MMDVRPAILLGASLSRWIVSRGYVEIVADAIAEAVVNERAAGRTYNVADAGRLSERQWVQKVADAAAWYGQIVEVPDDWVPAGIQFDGNLAQHWFLDTSRVRDELGYREPVVLEEALRRTVAWERANPPETIPPGIVFPYDAENATLTRLARRNDGAAFVPIVDDQRIFLRLLNRIAFVNRVAKLVADE
jgi:hypothetical protein